MYADEKMYNQVEDIRDVNPIERDLNNLSEYFRRNTIFINSDKRFRTSFTRNKFILLLPLSEES